MNCLSPRRFAAPPHHHVDDKPYGGGAGMVMMAGPIIEAAKTLREQNPAAMRIYLTPRGKPFDDGKAQELAGKSGLIFLCGRYRGIDERAIEYFDGEEISVGDYVLCGGELACMSIIEALSRHIPGVLGNKDSLQEEAFADGLLDAPCYTRPEKILDMEVPAVLRQGDHAAIAAWRQEQKERITEKKRPDLLKKKRR